MGLGQGQGAAGVGVYQEKKVGPNDCQKSGHQRLDQRLVERLDWSRYLG